MFCAFMFVQSFQRISIRPRAEPFRHADYRDFCSSRFRAADVISSKHGFIHCCQIHNFVSKRTFLCRRCICFSFIHRKSRSCLNHSQEPCEWAHGDLGVLWIEYEQILHLKVAVRISALFEIQPSRLPWMREPGATPPPPFDLEAAQVAPTQLRTVNVIRF